MSITIGGNNNGIVISSNAIFPTTLVVNSEDFHFDEQKLKSTITMDHFDQRIRKILTALCDRYKAGDVEPLIDFLGDYVSWNGVFANGVVRLTSLIGAAREIFIDPSQRIKAAADRSNFIASFIFEAARDEYSHVPSGKRACHRSLAQALLVRISELHPSLDYDRLFGDCELVIAANRATLTGYSGGWGDTREELAENLFFGMGYHAGSEILADIEFTLIDNALRDEVPTLSNELLKHTAQVGVGALDVDTYHWIRVHSGNGVAVEQHHAQMALSAINYGLNFVTVNKQICRRAVEAGFRAFSEAQHEFFNKHAPHGV